jgi:hypothetical protein
MGGHLSGGLAAHGGDFSNLLGTIPEGKGEGSRSCSKQDRRKGEPLMMSRWWATTFPLSLLPSRQLWKAGHRRWDVENDLFNTLSTHWGLDHCFKHESTAILNFILTLFIAFVLLQSFYLRNLKLQRRIHLTLIGIGDELHLSLMLMATRAPWLDKGG